MNENNSVVLEGRGLVKIFPVRSRGFRSRTQQLTAVGGIDITLRAGRTTAVVGESGSGKSTLARLLVGLHQTSGGSIHYNGSNIVELKGEDRTTFRRNVQMVVQDPYSSLSPRMRVRDIVAEPLVVMGLEKSVIKKRVTEVLHEVGLDGTLDGAKFPHQFSGGQRQRVAIAKAVVSRPRVVILDEPVSALDVSIRAQVMRLLTDLQETHGISYLMVTHDLGDVAQIAHEVTVMYLGRAVEQGPTQQVLLEPRHPYTRSLLNAVPTTRVGHSVLDSVRVIDDIPSPYDPPPGCAYNPRCPQRFDPCDQVVPAVTRDHGGAVACHLFTDISLPAPALRVPAYIEEG